MAAGVDGIIQGIILLHESPTVFRFALHESSFQLTLAAASSAIRAFAAPEDLLDSPMPLHSRGYDDLPLPTRPAGFE